MLLNVALKGVNSTKRDNLVDGYMRTRATHPQATHARTLPDNPTMLSNVVCML